MKPQPLRIDIVSDVVCPWCLIGYKHLKQALERWGGAADLHWQPFQLNPDMMEGGQNLAEHLAEKYGSAPEQGQRVRQRITELGAESGFEFNFEPEMRIYNTRKAHRLLYWAASTGKQTALKLSLFESYFTDLKAIDQDDVLVEAAKAAGLPEEDARTALNEQHYALDVDEVAQQWSRLGINSVPAVIFNRAVLVSGAQDVETYLKVLKEQSQSS